MSKKGMNIRMTSTFGHGRPTSKREAGLRHMWWLISKTLHRDKARGMCVTEIPRRVNKYNR